MIRMVEISVRFGIAVLLKPAPKASGSVVRGKGPSASKSVAPGLGTCRA